MYRFKLPVQRFTAVILALHWGCSSVIVPEVWAKGRRPPVDSHGFPNDSMLPQWQTKASTPTVSTDAVSTTVPVSQELPMGRSAELKMPLAPRMVSVNLKDATLGTILEVISSQTNVNFVTDEKIRNRRMTASLEKVSLEDALTALLDVNGLTYERIYDSNIYAVKERSNARPRIITRIYTLRNVQLSQLEGSPSLAGTYGTTSNQTIYQPQTSPSISIQTSGTPANNPAPQAVNDPLKTSDHPGILRVIATVLTEFGRIELDARTNSIAVTDIPERFPMVESIIRKLDIKSPQIMIQLEVIEADADAIDNFGLEYGGSDGTLAQIIGPARLTDFGLSKVGGSFFNGANGVDATATSGATTSGGSTIGGGAPYNVANGTFLGVLSLQQFQVLLRAIQTEAKGQFLARPKILTLNNKQAEINITADTAVGIQSASVTQSGLLVNTAERQPTGIVLRVTPQVNDENLVTMQLEPSVSRPQASTFFPGQFVDPQTRGLRTTVRVHAGDTILIGGLISDNDQTTVRKVPILGSIPLIGPLLFTSKSKTKSRTEIMIFITPQIVPS